MRPGGSKQKGSKFEREICSTLSLWISHGKSKDLLWRSSMSGGRGTLAFGNWGRTIKPVGDICAIDPEGFLLTDVFFIECKHLKKLDLGKFLLMGKGPLAPIWAKAKEEAKKYMRSPMLIAKENGKPIIAITVANALNAVCDPPSAITLDPEVRPLVCLLASKFTRRLPRA